MYGFFGPELGKQQLASRLLMVTNDCTSNLTKGSGTNLSAAIFGDFSDLYVGTWNEMEILVHQFSDFAKGATAFRVFQRNEIE